MCVILHMSVITQWGDSALMWAAMGGKTEVVVELVKAGANVDVQDDVCQYTLRIYMYSIQTHLHCKKSLVVLTLSRLSQLHNNSLPTTFF